MQTKRSPRARRRKETRLGALVGKLKALAVECAQCTGRIDRLELEYETQVRRCAQLQAEIDQLKRTRPSRRDR
ncbi:MAG TPA: hypothetical protein VHU82_09675 [Vicinamibacterales bacterium]|jgi:cell division protein FtsB|nr:hypothetical protein [Vicinamibacterales bacterium]